MKSFSRYLQVGFVSCCMILCAGVALAADEAVPAEKQDPYKDLPKRGSLAGSIDSGYGNTTVEGPWGGVDTEGENSSPIQGSVTKLDERTWLLKLFNNAEDKFRVNVEVVQYNLQNKRVKSNNFSFSIAGGESVERRITASPVTAHCVVNLRDWKAYPKQKSSKEIKEEIETRKKELKELESQLKTN